MRWEVKLTRSPFSRILADDTTYTSHSLDSPTREQQGFASDLGLFLERVIELLMDSEGKATIHVDFMSGVCSARSESSESPVVIRLVSQWLCETHMRNSSSANEAEVTITQMIAQCVQGMQLTDAADRVIDIQFGETGNRFAVKL